MRLVSFRADNGETHIGVRRGRSSEALDLTVWLSLKKALPQFDMTELITMGRTGLRLVHEALEASDDELREANALVEIPDERLLAPIPRPRKNVLCLGRNYAEHAAESSRAWGEAGEQKPPSYPTIFTKTPTTVIGPYAPVPYDAEISTQLDWECELAVIIGKAGKNIKREDAGDYIFGYMVLNDISARDIQQRHGGQFFKGKSLDGTCPCGPCIVTADELVDPNNLKLWTRVNGEEKQHDNTSSMMLDVEGTVEAVSLGMTLEPGDIIATGTPAGVGFARTPPEFLRPGDVVECEIEGIGTIRNVVESA